MLVQADNNVIIYNLGTGKSTWSTATNAAAGPVTFAQQSDGNVVVYDVNNKAVWAAAGVKPTGTYTLTMGDDGSLKTYNASNQAVWST